VHRLKAERFENQQVQRALNDVGVGLVHVDSGGADTGRL
jgi:hypothetical protein